MAAVILGETNGSREKVIEFTGKVRLGYGVVILFLSLTDPVNLHF
jgi:hypothetical protein